MKNKLKGFTLVELLVTIAIMAILSTVSIMSYKTFIDKSKHSSDMAMVMQANTLIKEESIVNKEFNINDAYNLLKDYNISPKLELETNILSYDRYNNQFVILNAEGDILYPKGKISKNNLYYPIKSNDEIIKKNLSFKPIYYILGDVDINSELIYYSSGVNLGGRKIDTNTIDIDSYMKSRISKGEYIIENGILNIKGSFNIKNTTLIHNKDLTIISNETSLVNSNYLLNGSIYNKSLTLSNNTTLYKNPSAYYKGVLPTLGSGSRVLIDNKVDNIENLPNKDSYKINDTSYNTLAEAVASASPNDIINIASGIYELDSLNITKPISIIGSTNTIFLPSANIVSTIGNNAEVIKIREMKDNNEVNIKNITFMNYTNQFSIIKDVISMRLTNNSSSYKLNLDNINFINIYGSSIILGAGIYNLNKINIMNTTSRGKALLIRLDGGFSKSKEITVNLSNSSFTDKAKQDNSLSYALEIRGKVNLSLSNNKYIGVEEKKVI